MPYRALFLAAVLAAGGCGASEAPAPANAERPAVPLTFKQATPDAQVELNIDRRIAAWPGLHKRLYDRAVEELKAFAKDAVASRADSVGPDYSPPIYERALDWSLAAATDKLVSLRQSWYEGTGGAHPNHGYDAMLWDPQAEAEVTRQELFLPAGPADAAIDQRLCAAIKAARAEKGVETDAAYDEVWPCPKWRDAEFELVPSTAAGKFGGVNFLFDPYAIGSYAEGEYEVLLPQSVFSGVVAPRWAGDFAGEPNPPAKTE